MSTHVLDLSKVKFSLNDPRNAWPKIIPLNEGKHSLDFDIAEDELPPETVKNFRKLSAKQLKVGPKYGESKPIGINACAIPLGSVIRKL